MTFLTHDIRQALRALGRNPGFTAAALTMALGIGSATPAEPWSLAAVAAALVGAALLACAIPARRAGRLDPVQVLRSE